ncbi:MAG: coproporphyrinogen dehydrogenase HemZ [Coprococcus sp.]
MIALHMNRTDYENDIRALLMAFFYGEKIVLDAVEWTQRLEVCYGDNMVMAKMTDREGKLETGSVICDFADYKETRNRLKRMVYGVLTAYTGQTLPWGTLTGIRPTKLPMELFEKGAADEEAISYLKKHYLVSDEKAALCAEVARNEEAVLRGIDYGNTFSLYVGIPFCPSICAYCSFSSYPLAVWEKQVDVYLDALEKEIEAAASMMGKKELLTFYMGGGTPTSLSAEQMDRLLTCLEKHFNIFDSRERTIEAGRPDSITEDKLKVLKKHQISRISINPQTMNQATLDLIGRRHTIKDVTDAFYMARSLGFENINMDLIAGLPGENSEHMRRTMDAIVELRPDSVTVHSLALKRAAFLNQNREQFPVAPADEVNRMIGISHEGAEAIQAAPYYLYRQKNIAGNLENVGYARKGCEGLYNILIMEEKQSILALGAGASSKFVFEGNGGPRIERVENVKSVRDYIERVGEMIERKKTFFEKQAK